jgi:hypothetical protein
MRRALTVLSVLPVIAAPALGLGLASPAQADTGPEHFSFSADATGSFDDCGFVVDFTQSGTGTLTLWRGADGLVTKERDGAVNVRQTFTREDTGVTISYVIASTSTWDYGAGAQLGSPVTATFTGTGSRLPGSGPDAGRLVLSGTVVGFDDATGAPLVDLPEQDALFIRGHHPDGDICDALA